MSYDAKLAQRVRDIFADGPSVDEKAMFGGLAFMLEGKMCCGVLKSELVARVGPEQYDAALARPHTRPMDFTGRPMKGYVYVAAEGCGDRRSLQSWLDRAVRFVGELPSSTPARKRGSARLRRTRRASGSATITSRSKKGVRR